MTDTTDIDATDIDVAVIGLGSAGENIARRLADAGRSVVGFEPGRVGGECPFEACIPSKVLLHHAAIGSDWPTAKAHRDGATSELDDSEHAAGLRDAGVEIVRAGARIDGDHVVVAHERRWRADHVIVATGGRPALPPIDGLDRSTPIWTSERYLTTDVLPGSLLVLGGGAIGTEIATMHQHFGDSTTLIDHSSLLGGTVDDEVAAVLREQLTKAGVEVHTDASIERVVVDDGGATMWFTGRPPLSADALLVATGKQPRWDGLGLASLGIDEPVVDDALRIDGRDWLRAIGDVNETAPWTHGANHQARWLADRLLGQAWPAPRMDRMPHCVFTNPPVAAVGRSASQAAADGIDVVRGTATYADVARGTTDRLDDGLVVVVVDRHTRRLVGCSGVGARFDDVISTFTGWLHAGLTVDDASRIVIPFPTMTEVLTPALEDARAQL